MSELKFNSGQSVQPAYEGWTRNPDGSRSMWFGYMNRNWEETPDIPAGPNNGFGGGGEDLGQPTHFLPRRQAFVFKVNVPADWPADKDLVWTRHRERHHAEGVRIAVAGLGDRRTDDVGEQRRAHRAHVRRARESAADDRRRSCRRRSIAVGQPLTLVLPVKDDGLPTPEIRARGTGGPRGTRRRRPNAPAPDPFAEAARGQFRVKWVQYRGAGKAQNHAGRNRRCSAPTARPTLDRREVDDEGHVRSRRAPTRCARMRWTAMRSSSRRTSRDGDAVTS